MAIRQIKEVEKKVILKIRRMLRQNSHRWCEFLVWTTNSELAPSSGFLRFGAALVRQLGRFAPLFDLI